MMPERLFGWIMVLAVLAGLAACSGQRAPGIAADAGLPVSAGEIDPPLVVPAGLPLPSWIALIRVAGGAVTPVPAAEQVLWTGAMKQVSQGLLYPLRVRPLILREAGAPMGWSGLAGAGDGPGLPARLEVARQAGFDAVLVYALDARAESDWPAASVGELPMVGGIIADTVTTEAHGTARALLIGTSAGAVLGRSDVRMVDRPLAPVRVTGGRGGEMQGWAEYALLQTLLPAAEDMLTTVVAAGY